MGSEIVHVWMIGMALLFAALTSLVTIMGTRTLRKFNTYVCLVRQRADIIEQKLDVVHDITNSRLHGIEEELRETKHQLQAAVDEAAQRTARQPTEHG